MNREIYQFGTLLAGKWVAGEGAPFDTIDPADPSQQAGLYRASSASQVGAVVEAAVCAQKEWAAVPGLERQMMVAKYLNALRAKTEKMAVAMTREMGKPVVDGRGEVGWALIEAEFMLAEAARPYGQVLPSFRRSVQNITERRPRGVIAAVSPWNYPFLTPMRKIVPALVFGNAIVLKPSEFSPAAACIAAELASGILPDGLFGIVMGKGDVGRALVSHPKVAGVTFTGSVPTGRAIYQCAAQNLAEVSLELGGKNPIILHDTGDLDACLDDIVRGVMANGGQRCTGVSRLVVRKSLMADVEAGLKTRFDRLVVGHGMDEKTQIGPMAMRSHHEKVLSMIAAGRAENARIVSGGERAAPAGFENGYFVQPTLLCDVTPAMSVATQEIFGPVLSVLAYEHIDDALKIANGVEFGLATSLFSEDMNVVRRFTERAEAGMLHVNHQTVSDPNMPFIGIKNSGVGAGSVGQSAVNFYTSERSIYVKYGVMKQ